jgi:hypothetical protein
MPSSWPSATPFGRGDRLGASGYRRGPSPRSAPRSGRVHVGRYGDAHPTQALLMTDAEAPDVWSCAVQRRHAVGATSVRCTRESGAVSRSPQGKVPMAQARPVRGRERGRPTEAVGALAAIDSALADHCGVERAECLRRAPPPEHRVHPTEPTHTDTASTSDSRGGTTQPWHAAVNPGIVASWVSGHRSLAEPRRPSTAAMGPGLLGATRTSR